MYLAFQFNLFSFSYVQIEPSGPVAVTWQIIDDDTPDGMPAREPETGSHYR